MSNEATSEAKAVHRHVAVPFLELRSSTAALDEALLDDIAALMRTGVFVNGPRVKEFERAFADFCGRSFCVGVASGLDALRLGLLALGLEPGDEVIVPAMTFVATFKAVVQAGGKPVVVDVREDDVCIDPELAAGSVSERTRFLLPVHLYGQMADVRALRSLAARHSLLLLEDACQAHGAERDSIRAGSAGEAAAFSFYPSKNLGAMGDAGAIVLDDERADGILRALREHGETTKYHSRYVGYTARLDALQAVVLAHKLPLLETWNAERRDAAAFYVAALAGVGDLRLPVTVPGATHVWHVFAVRTADPDGLIAHLAEHGIGTGRHYPQPPHLSEAFVQLGHRRGSFPVAEQIAKETVSLPLFPGISEEQLQVVVDAVTGFFERG